MSVPLVASIVLNWNGKEDTRRCLDALARVRYPNSRVYVVDNGSTDGSLRALEASHPSHDRLIYIVSAENRGYAGGNNLGIARALDDGAEYVLILNNDVVIDPDSIQQLVDAARTHSMAGVLGPKVLCDPDRRLVYSRGESYSLWGNRRRIAVGEPDQVGETAPRTVDYVVGCAMLVSRAFISRVGMLDETFFAYYDEVDWCLRGRKQRFEVLYVPQAVVYHKGGGSSGGWLNPITAYYRTRNWIYFMRKHAAPYHWFVFVPVFTVVFCQRVAIALARADVAILGSLFRALWWQVWPRSAWGRIDPAVMRPPRAAAGREPRRLN